VSPYVWTVKTALGAAAVQVVYSSHRGSQDIGRIGSAHVDRGGAWRTDLPSERSLWPYAPGLGGMRHGLIAYQLVHVQVSFAALPFGGSMSPPKRITCAVASSYAIAASARAGGLTAGWRFAQVSPVQAQVSPPQS
jgi:hypothetical protein